MSIKPILNRYIIDISSKLNWICGRYKNPIWIVGDGRSGTTWVSEIINWNGKYRELFEPFHPSTLKNFNSSLFHYYLRPNDNSDKIISTLKKIYSGKYIHNRSEDRNRIGIHDGLIIKDIFSNLYVAWVRNNFPNIKIVFVIRNPFSVALSKFKLKDWMWMKDPMDFTKQSLLMKDFLEPYEDIINNIGPSFFEKQIAIWSIIHLVPFKQLSANDIHIVFYENLFTETEMEVKKMFNFIFRDTFSFSKVDLLNHASRPSRLSYKRSNILKGKSPVHSWKKEISKDNISKGFSVLNKFGLKNIYDNDSLPIKKEWFKLMK
jgi:hypothetical protein